MIRIIEPGPLTTVQDEGRWGYQSFGMPVAGAMDRYAYRIANILVGNPPGSAALEMTLRGGVFQFERPCVIAICGAEMEATLNGRLVVNWSAFRVAAGDELRMDFASAGCRAYLAVQGGIDVPAILGSRSTYTRAAIGGFEGRPLRAGDTLPVGSQFDPAVHPQQLDHALLPRYENPIAVRVMPGPQDDHFTPAAIDTFFGSTFTIAPDADRMGYRLDGLKIDHRGSPDIISDPLCNGSIQVPGHGHPMILMADHQTTGGYPKIGTVIGPDLSRLAQARPGDSIHFIHCTEPEALDALRAERAAYDQIARLVRGPVMRFQITINGVNYQAEVKER